MQYVIGRTFHAFQVRQIIQNYQTLCSLKYQMLSRVQLKLGYSSRLGQIPILSDFFSEGPPQTLCEYFVFVEYDLCKSGWDKRVDAPDAHKGDAVLLPAKSSSTVCSRKMPVLAPAWRYPTSYIQPLFWGGAS